MSDRLRDLNERIAALLRKGSPIPDAVYKNKFYVLLNRGQSRQFAAMTAIDWAHHSQ